jgi:hypothetical protein
MLPSNGLIVSRTNSGSGSPPSNALSCRRSAPPTHGYDASVPKLEVAADQNWLDCLGVSPEAEVVSDDEYVRGARVPIADAEEVQFTWDLTDDSVRVRHHRDGQIVSDLFREMATLLTVIESGPATEVIIEYGSDGWSGRARIQVLPAVLIEDKLLRS